MKHRLLGAAVAGCALAAVSAGPVHAQSDQLWIGAPSETVLPGPDADGGTSERTFEVRVSHDNVENDVPSGRLTVDASEIASFAQVSWPPTAHPSLRPERSVTSRRCPPARTASRPP